ncbi:plantaricin C family lantibiotic [Bacillus sp. YC2]|uniref:Amyloliquecidin alpha n=1 Tax=Bacillus amyloliquefaciens TaxID=1390 RepID=A0A166EUU9_BACAM|nr:plantaricin C family lantibiotic [Bacillus sp. YC2]ANA04695.1 amyloliquecidin alpha [Bacillus amyloliquefaciens]MBY8914203.1 plantaricin C family lantibiotic [Bacillus sp. YC2]
MSIIETWKNPALRMNSQVVNPAGDLMEELSDNEMEMLAGGCAWYDISCKLGNKGAWCTLTVECQSSCN